MKVSEINLYTGFEGEPELVFTQSSDVHEEKLRLWEGHFETIMTQKENLSSSNEWTGLAHYYHLCLGCWDDDQDNWQIPDIEEALNPLREIKLVDSDDQAIIALNALVSFLTEALNNKNIVFISRY